MTAAPDAATPALRLSSGRGRWVLAATVLGSSMAFLDSTVVNVALPTIGRELHASLGGLQWTVNGYTLSLAGLILLGGSLGDRLGRRRVFMIGVVWFALASAVCGFAPNIGVLIGARVLEGVGGALLTPGSLAIIQATFAEEDRPRAVGAWSGLGGVAGAVGPLLGGVLVQSVGWRWVFFLNLPLAVVVLVVDRAARPGEPGRDDRGQVRHRGRGPGRAGPGRDHLRADRGAQPAAAAGSARWPPGWSAWSWPSRSWSWSAGVPGTRIRWRRCCPWTCSARASSARST